MRATRIAKYSINCNHASYINLKKIVRILNMLRLLYDLIVFARKHIKFEIDSYCHISTFSQVIDTKASNHCKKVIPTTFM